ncbi:hypothetical protein EVA_07061, partial [gut metagenome]
EPGFRDDAESFLQIRRLLDSFGSAGRAEPSAAFAGTAGLPVPACPPETNRQKTLLASDTPVGEIWVAGIFGRSKCLYGILLLLRYTL